jgi:hypothetical protein
MSAPEMLRKSKRSNIFCQNYAKIMTPPIKKCGMINKYKEILEQKGLET